LWFFHAHSEEIIPHFFPSIVIQGFITEIKSVGYRTSVMLMGFLPYFVTGCRYDPVYNSRSQAKIFLIRFLPHPSISQDQHLSLMWIFTFINSLLVSYSCSHLCFPFNCLYSLDLQNIFWIILMTIFSFPPFSDSTLIASGSHDHITQR
jgi:hypothetical protein